MQTPSCTLIVSTYNWEAALSLVLASALRQRQLPDEILVADDGSGPATAAVVHEVAAASPVPIGHVWHEDRGFRLSAIRNRALAQARGEYVLMVDGDMVLHPEFVGSHLRFARRDTYVQGSRVMLREAITRRVLEGAATPIGPLTAGIGNRLNALHLPWLSGLYTGPSSALRRSRGCNLAYWHADVLRVNGFNEDIVGWGREDSEFVARLQNSGVRRRNLKFAGVAYHLWHPTRSQDAVPANHAIFEHVVRERITRCERGLDQYLAEPTPPRR